jgi:hypothetical protein
MAPSPFHEKEKSTWVYGCRRGWGAGKPETLDEEIRCGMIVFDLECGKGHVFEGWFNDLQAFEEQNARGLIRCPLCESAAIRKILSPVAMKKSPPVPPNETEKTLIDYKRLAREIVEHIKKNFDDVGPRFAQEALKMHYAVIEKKNIRGSATAEEEKMLEKEGIEFFKIPFGKADEEKKN